MEMRVSIAALGSMGCLAGFMLLGLAIIPMPPEASPSGLLSVPLLLADGFLLVAVGANVLLNPDWYRPSFYHRALTRSVQSIMAFAVQKKWTTNSRPVPGPLSRPG
jgi:hypothetical protein